MRKNTSEFVRNWASRKYEGNMKIRGKIALIFGVTIVFLMSGVGYFAVKSCYDILMDQVEDSVVSSAQLAAGDGKTAGRLYAHCNSHRSQFRDWSR